MTRPSGSLPRGPPAQPRPLRPAPASRNWSRHPELNPDTASNESCDLSINRTPQSHNLQNGDHSRTLPGPRWNRRSQGLPTAWGTKKAPHLLSLVTPVPMYLGACVA